MRKIKSSELQLNFNSNAHKNYRNSNFGGDDDLMFDDATTGPHSLEALATVSLASGDGFKWVTGTPNKAKTIHTMLFNYGGDNTGSDWLDNHAGARYHFYVKSSVGAYDQVGIESHLDLIKTLSIKDSTGGSLGEAVFSQDDAFTRIGFHADGSYSNGAAPATRVIQKIVALKAGGAAVGGLFLEANQSLFFSDGAADTAVNIQRVLLTVEGNASQKCIQTQGHILPQADNSFNLGTADRRFANLYTGDLHLCNEGGGNDIDGTSGNWTVQEGEDSLFVINNKTGKKFKMMLQPVEDEE